MDTDHMGTILEMIVAKCLQDRETHGLVLAYIQELVDMAEDEGRPTDEISVGVIDTQAECEQVIGDAYTLKFVELDPSTTRDEALESFVYPQGLDTDRVPRQVLEVVGAAMGRQAARDALQMRQWAAQRKY